MPKENQIIANYLQGDTESFGQIYDRYFSKIYNFIYYKVHSRADAEDLTSEVFHKVILNLRKFDSVKGNFSTWIYAIARNTVIDFYRKNHPTENIEDIFDLCSTHNLEQETDAKIKLKKIENYLAQLKPAQREIVILRVWEGLTFREIAQIVGKNEPAVKVAFARVVAQMSEEILLAYFIILLAN